MELDEARDRWRFLAHALNGTGGFSPRISYGRDLQTGAPAPMLSGPSYLERYPRESMQKYSARNALALYENHLLSAVTRFVAFLARRPPTRIGVNGGLPKAFIEDADLQGSSLDSFWTQFAMQAAARGALLLVIDRPLTAAQSLGEQQRARLMPYIRAAMPEDLESFETDPESGMFSRAVLTTRECLDDADDIDGDEIETRRTYTTTDWIVEVKDSGVDGGWRTIGQGAHGFGQCPVIPFTEDGRQFPIVGRYAQIADLSRAIFNRVSELDELMRSQTFSLLTMQVPGNQLGFDATKTAATIGAHSMLTYSGERPGFIAPDAGPAATIERRIERLEQSVARVKHDTATASDTSRAESGISRRLRFDVLNAELTLFASRLHRLETIVWKMFSQATQTGGGVVSVWPVDFNLADVGAELDILASMQATGFPARVLVEKRRAVAGVEFDNSDEDTKAAIERALEEQAREAENPPPEPPPAPPPAIPPTNAPTPAPNPPAGNN